MRFFFFVTPGFVCNARASLCRPPPPPTVPPLEILPPQGQDGDKKKTKKSAINKLRLPDMRFVPHVSCMCVCVSVCLVCVRVCDSLYVRVVCVDVFCVWMLVEDRCAWLCECQKRPTTVSKETYYSVKRDLLQCQKRPTTVSKET